MKVKIIVKLIAMLMFIGGGGFAGYKIFSPEPTEAVVEKEDEVPVEISYILQKIESENSLIVSSVDVWEYQYKPQNWVGKASYLVSDAEIRFEYDLSNIDKQNIYEGDTYFEIKLKDSFEADVEFIDGENNIRGWGNLFTTPEAVKEMYTKAEKLLEEEILMDEDTMNDVKKDAIEAISDFLGVVTTKEIRIYFE